MVADVAETFARALLTLIAPLPTTIAALKRRTLNATDAWVSLRVAFKV